MSKGFLRGLSFGIILATFIFTLYLGPFEENIDDIEQKPLSKEDIYAYIKNERQTLIPIEELKKLKQIEIDQVHLESTVKELKEVIEQLKKVEDTSISSNSNSIETNVKHYLLEIKSGMNSSDVSKILMDVEIIKSATDFEDYLRARNRESSIQIGKFTLNSSMTLEEITKIITKIN